MTRVSVKTCNNYRRIRYLVTARMPPNTTTLKTRSDRHRRKRRFLYMIPTSSTDEQTIGINRMSFVFSLAGYCLVRGLFNDWSKFLRTLFHLVTARMPPKVTTLETHSDTVRATHVRRLYTKPHIIYDGNVVMPARTICSHRVRHCPGTPSSPGNCANASKCHHPRKPLRHKRSRENRLLYMYPRWRVTVVEPF